MVEKNRHEQAPIAPPWRGGVAPSLDLRTVVDDHGRVWTVRETDTSKVPGARAPWSLIFDTDGYCFRVWSYPLDWQELSNGELLALGRVICDD